MTIFDEPGSGTIRDSGINVLEERTGDERTGKNSTIARLDFNKQEF